MPELPEVETTVRFVRPRLVGRRIVDFRSRWAKNVSPSAAAVRRLLTGRKVVALTRRAKFVVFELDDGGALLVHLRMSGRLEWRSESAGRHTRAWWDLDDGSRLLFCDARKFGRIVHTHDLAATTANLGPEPLDVGFTTAQLRARLHGRARLLKPALLDQSVVAGLGNIYTDEALFYARLHPLRRTHELTAPEVGRLHRAIRYVLRKGIQHNGASIDWVYPGGTMQDVLAVYGRAGAACRRCATPILSLRVGQRGTHVCPRCQPDGARVSTRR